MLGVAATTTVVIILSGHDERDRAVVDAIEMRAAIIRWGPFQLDKTQSNNRFCVEKRKMLGERRSLRLPTNVKRLRSRAMELALHR